VPQVLAFDSLAAMNWRRALLLAGINLAVAVPMIWMMEARDQQNALTSEEIMAKAPNVAAPKPPQPVTPEASPEQAEQTVSFNPCSIWVHYPVQVVVVQSADMPSLLLSGWEDDCPPHWSLAGRLRGNRSWPPTPLWMETQRKIDAGLCLFIAIQWFLMGALPLVRTRKRWAEPGVFITACSVLAGAIAMTPVIDGLARLPASIAMLTWILWFGFLVGKALQFVWRRRTIVS